MMDLQRALDGNMIAPESTKKFVSGPALTMTLKTDKERKRRSTPKSRNGCYSCKIRRVKCDETRPAPCARCKKFGSTCDGYPDSRKPLSQASILPKQVRKHSIRFINVNPSCSNDEAYYFSCYCNKTAAQIGGPFITNLWVEIVPQVSQESSSIKHMIIALGALTAARHEICQKYGYYDYDKVSNSNKHHQYALQQYSEALKGMREAFQYFTKDSMQPLIASLLVFCFECLLGHRSAASAHASSTVSLISELQFKRLDGSLAFSAPEPHELDIDLYAAFSNLDLQALLFVDNRPWTTHQSLHNEMNNIIQKIPDVISGIKNCRNYWQVIMRRNLHFVAAARAATINSPAPKESVDEITTLCLGNNIWSNPPVELRGLYTSLLIERELCVKDIRKWECASATLLEDNSNTTADDTQNFLIASLLKIHAAMNIVLLSRTFYPPEIATDKFLPEFKTIVDLSYSVKHLLIPTSPADNAPLFHFDIGILPALSQVGLLCRDKEVRGRAIALLLDNPGYREAIWESDAVGQICDFVRGMEEVWCDEDGFVPGDRRATMLEVEFEGRSCKAEFVQRMGSREEDVVVRSERFTW